MTLFLLTFFVLKQSSGQIAKSLSFYKKIKDYDLSSVLNPDSITDDGNEKQRRPELLGFIDSSFQRFQIHFTSFVKSKSNPYEYVIIGKTKIKDNICNFKGTITVVAAIYDTTSLMRDIGFPTYREGNITSKVMLYEDKKQYGSGTITGELSTDIYFDDKGKIYYSALMLVADGYSNNQFKGSWTSYNTGKTKKCNWGDFRIPESDGLDGGTGEFMPQEKYLDNGWRDYYNYLIGGLDESKRLEAERIENIKWWR